MKTKGIPSLLSLTCQWETVATNFDEFQDVSEKLFASNSRTEASLGEKLKIDMLPDIGKIHKKKEKLIKKQHREAILLDNSLTVEWLATGGRSLRDRKPLTYAFDDYDRSINEAIKDIKDEIQGLKVRLRFRKAEINWLEAVASRKISAERPLGRNEEYLKKIEALRNQFD